MYALPLPPHLVLWRAAPAGPPGHCRQPVTVRGVGALHPARRAKRVFCKTPAHLCLGLGSASCMGQEVRRWALVKAASRSVRPAVRRRELASRVPQPASNGSPVHITPIMAFAPRIVGPARLYTAPFPPSDRCPPILRHPRDGERQGPVAAVYELLGRVWALAEAQQGAFRRPPGPPQQQQQARCAALASHPHPHHPLLHPRCGQLSLEEARVRIQAFADEREWQQYHTPRNLLLALVGEVRAQQSPKPKCAGPRRWRDGPQPQSPG
jgi:hypothetical protein